MFGRKKLKEEIERIYEHMREQDAKIYELEKELYFNNNELDIANCSAQLYSVINKDVSTKKILKQVMARLKLKPHVDPPTSQTVKVVPYKDTD